MLECSCCCTVFGIVIYNSNEARDDNFKIVLNGIQIGQISNNDNLLTGRIFTDSDHTAEFTPLTIATPNPNSFEASVAFDFALLVNGVNALRIESIQNNGNNNFGQVRVGYWSKNPIDRYALDLPALLVDFYSFFSGVGAGQNYTFNYP